MWYIEREGMIKKIELPIFPLSILPIPGEHVPLHIFEPRYQQLLLDIESNQGKFGIYYSHGLNKDRLGAIVELEEVVNRYPSGEADIVVKCVDSFLLSRFWNQFMPKLYPGGVITPLNAFDEVEMSGEFKEVVQSFLALKGEVDYDDYNIHDVAVSLDLDIEDRLKYTKLLEVKKREAFLRERLRYRKFILMQEEKIKGRFFLN